MAKAENKYIRTANGNTMDYLYENASLNLREMIHVTPEWSEVTADQAHGACGNHPSVIEIREEVVVEETINLQEGDAVHEESSVEDVTVPGDKPKRAARRDRG